MPELSAPESDARPAGRRRTGLFVAGALILLLLGLPLLSTDNKTPSAEAKGEIKEATGSQPPGVVQLRAPEQLQPRTGNSPYVLSLDQEVYVDVRSPDIWLLQLMNALGKQDLDPRTKVTLDTVVFDPGTEKEKYDEHQRLKQEKQNLDAERQRIEALPEDSPEKQVGSDALKQREASLSEKANKLLEGRRYFAWDDTVKEWLERSCLIVNGRVFRDLQPQFAYEWWEYDRYITLRFRILLTQANKKQWLELLGGIGLAPKPVSVSIAMVDLFEPGKTEIMPSAINPSNSEERTPEWQKVSLKAATDWLTWLLLDCFFLLFLLFLYYAFSTKILRDLAPDGLWHLSLGRCQMAFWFFIVTGSYIFLWIVTGDYNTLTSQELLLLGISSITGLGAFFITDRSGVATRPRGSDLLTREEMELENAEELQAKIASKSPKTAKLTSAEALSFDQRRVAELERRAAYYKKGWSSALWRSLNDLLSEANDGRPSFHRFQMICWNLAFGVIFLRTVYYTLAMPQFSSDQLLLMGISNGTYLGFKWSVTQSEKERQAAA